MAAPEDRPFDRMVKPFIMPPESDFHVVTGKSIAKGGMICGMNDLSDEINLLKERKIDYRIKYFFESIHQNYIELSISKYSQANSLKNWAFDVKEDAAEVLVHDWKNEGRIRIPLKGFFEKYGILRLRGAQIKLRVINEGEIRAEIVK